MCSGPRQIPEESLPCRPVRPTAQSPDGSPLPPALSTPSRLRDFTTLRLPPRRPSSSDWLAPERPSNENDVFWPRGERKEVVRNPRRPEREAGSARCLAWAAWPQTLVVITRSACGCWRPAGRQGETTDAVVDRASGDCEGQPRFQASASSLLHSQQPSRRRALFKGVGPGGPRRAEGDLLCRAFCAALSPLTLVFLFREWEGIAEAVGPTSAAWRNLSA